jgi:zinc protease
MQLFSQRMTTTEAGGVTCMTIPVPGNDAITIVGSFPAGKAYGMDTHPFVAYLTVRMLEEGTKSRSKDDISEELESRGANVSFESDTLHARFVVQCIKGDSGAILDVVVDMLADPLFDEDLFEKMKERVVAELVAESDDPAAVAKRAFTRALYPENHPLYLMAHDDAIRSLKTLTLDMVKEFHAAHYGRGGLRVAVVGDIAEEKLSGIVHDAFARLEERVVKTPIIPEPLSMYEDIVVSLPEKESAVFFAGAPFAIGPWDEEYDALKFGLDVLGGGTFANRLMEEVREKKGLTYSTRVRVDGFDGRMYGYWSAFGFFPPRSLKEGKSAILEEIEGLVGEEGVTLVESEEKKIELTGRFPVMFDRRETFAVFALKASEQGLSEEYWDTYVERINNLTRKEVNDALRKYIHPKKLGMATAGDVERKKKQKKKS